MAWKQFVQKRQARSSEALVSANKDGQLWLNAATLRLIPAGRISDHAELFTDDKVPHRIAIRFVAEETPFTYRVAKGARGTLRITAYNLLTAIEFDFTITRRTRTVRWDRSSGMLVIDLSHA